jgi:hypothetical protein
MVPRGLSLPLKNSWKLGFYFLMLPSENHKH